MIDLRHGDCIEIMRTIPDGSIDCVLTDPPYGTTACKWDSVIPFDLMWAELKRITKPTAAVVLFGSEPFSSALRMSNIKNYKYDWVWDKTQSTNFCLAKKQPMRTYESISVFYEVQCTYLPIMTPKKRVIDDRNWKSSGNGSVHGSFQEQGKSRSVRTESYPKNIISINSTSNECNNLKRVHPTQKPVALMAYLVRTYTQKGETVIDFTMGSGSTGVACVQEGRAFIGIERDDVYFKAARERITDAARQGSLF